MGRRTSSRLKSQVATAHSAVSSDEPKAPLARPRARSQKKAPAAAEPTKAAGAGKTSAGAIPKKGAQTRVKTLEAATRKRKINQDKDCGDQNESVENPTGDKTKQQKKNKPVKEKTVKEKAAKATCPLPDREMEFALWKEGFQFVAGVDEAGRGPLAGPVVAAACILPSNANTALLEGINDSKDVREEQREEIYERLINHPDVIWAIGIKDHSEIDRVNILKATMNAMACAVSQLPTAPDYILIDGNRCPLDLKAPSRAIIGGDAKVTAIAAASIIAKVTRDRIMRDLDKQYPQYGFAGHKGYGTSAHRQLIHQHGPSEVHRRSFNPVKSMLGWTPPEGYSNKT